MCIEHHIIHDHQRQHLIYDYFDTLTALFMDKQKKTEFINLNALKRKQWWVK